MDDLSSKINQILGDPQALEQIKGLSQMLGMSNDESPPAQSEKNHDSSFNMLSNLSGGINNDALSMITKVAPLLSNISKEDDTTRLLFALRPFLSDERKKKLNQAEKIIKMMKLLPLLKDTPLLDSLF